MKQLNKEETKEYFDSLLLKEFREIINSSNVFSDVPKYRHYWNLICALLDCLGSATCRLS